MTRRYFDLYDDVYISGRWELGNPTDWRGQEIEDPYQFADGHAVNTEERLKVPIDRPGTPLDFSLAGLGSVPIVHERVAAIMARLAPDDVQVIPVEIDGQPERYCILVATRLVRCIDDENSAEVKRWKPEDGRPDRVGEYRAVYGMRIDPAKVGDAKVFRPWGWPVVLIVSEDIKQALESERSTGVKFRDVTGPSATRIE